MKVKLLGLLAIAGLLLNTGALRAQTKQRNPLRILRANPCPPSVT